MSSRENSADPPEHATRWLSIGLEVLMDQLSSQQPRPPGPDFDVLIVGSGYGGAAAAAQLSACVDARGHACG